ncbi:transposase, partial [Streptomyces minutiscleroticus]|uniref:transposase n=1 Tax=Streptomyces minutiscleroticus TaxID=68238 RepID=UPI00167EB8B1
TVYGYFAHWQRDGVLHQLHGFLHRLTRQSQGRAVEPGAGALDTQSVKTSNNVPRTSQGADVGKRIVGRKRGAVTDSLGLLLTVLATAAGRSDSAIAPHLLDTVHAAHPRLRKMWADSAFRTTVLQHAAHLGIDLEVVQRTPGTKGFTPPPRRWVIERTYGWFMIFRRLARDHETLTVRSEALIELRMIDLMTRRLTGESTPTWRDPTPLNETPSPG